jgi:hypothetical protein
MQIFLEGNNSATFRLAWDAGRSQNITRLCAQWRSTMKNYRMLLSAVILGLGFGVATTVSAQATSSPPAGMNNPKAPDNNMKATAPNNSFSGWMTDYSKSHDGRISRQAYMDEAGKRWDSTDKNNQGLTSDQINGMYGSGSTGGNVSVNKDNKGK